MGIPRCRVRDRPPGACGGVPSLLLRIYLLIYFFFIHACQFTGSGLCDVRCSRETRQQVRVCVCVFVRMFLSLPIPSNLDARVNPFRCVRARRSGSHRRDGVRKPRRYDWLMGPMEGDTVLLREPVSVSVRSWERVRQVLNHISTPWSACCVKSAFHCALQNGFGATAAVFQHPLEGVCYKHITAVFQYRIV